MSEIPFTNVTSRIESHITHRISLTHSQISGIPHTAAMLTRRARKFCVYHSSDYNAVMFAKECDSALERLRAQDLAHIEYYVYLYFESRIYQDAYLLNSTNLRLTLATRDVTH